MPRTVKIRPDQPLFKADAFHMPLWIHAPFEVIRGIVRWFTVTLEKDNPHRTPLDNATFNKRAKKPHRVAFWSGKPVVKGPKWRVMAWRWGLVFTVLFMVKYLPLAGWKWIGLRLGDVLVFFGHVCSWAWRHWALLPIVFAAIVAGAWLVTQGVRELRTRLKARVSDGDAAQWYDVVLYLRDRFMTFVHGRGGQR